MSTATRGLNTGGQITYFGTGLNSTFRTGLWLTCPLLEYHFDQSIGVLYREQFHTYDATNDWTLTQATSGSAAVSTTAPGALTLDAGATTANQGANLQALKAAFVPAANKDIWAEFYVSLTAATPPVTKWQGFIGLAASDTTIIAAGSMSTNNRIGWMTEASGNLALTFTCDKAGTHTTKTGTTLVDATKVRLGFRYDGTADTVQQYINGVSTGTAVATADIPKLVVYPSLVCQSDGTDQPKLTVHGFQIFQLR